MYNQNLFLSLQNPHFFQNKKHNKRTVISIQFLLPASKFRKETEQFSTFSAFFCS